jgi:opacity protein-like surface antigen
MNRFTKPLACLALFATIIFPSWAAAADWEQFNYWKLDGGPLWTSSTGVKDLFGPVRSGTRVDFGTGASVGLGAGYRLTDWFAAELETGFMVSPIESITGAAQVDGTVFNCPLMVNGVFQIPNRSRFTPYAGLGIGGAFSTLDLAYLNYGNTMFSGSSSAAVFAFQGFAGLRFALTEHSSLGLEYRFLRTGGPSYEMDSGFYANLHSDHVQFEAMTMQSVGIRFDVHF